MASAPGASIRDAYGSKAPLKPRETPAEFVPKSSAGLKAELASNAAAVARDVKAATSGDPFARRPGGELPASTLPQGGRKSRRRKSRRRGGAMIKTPRELLADLEREPTRATLENVLSDMKSSDHQIMRDFGIVFADQVRAPLAAGERMDDRIQRIIEDTKRSLRAYGRGGRRKTTRRR